MKIYVKIEMILEHIWTLGRTPRFSNQAIYVGAKHGASMIKRKQRIAVKLFKFSLSSDTAPSALIALMVSALEKLTYKIGVKLMLI